jgi:predicted NBD/HSP70 family sugar kinase
VKHAPEIKAVSIGVPAVADVERATVVAAFLYRNLQNLDFKSLLEEDLDATVYVENTVKLCALAEKRYGIAKDYKDIVFVDVSNGIGAGIIIENNLLRGAIGAAGEIGYAVLSPENLNFHVNDKGFLEKYASTESLKEKAVAAVSTGEQTVLLDQCYGRSEDITPVMVFEAALAGDPVSKRIVDEGINLITITVLNLILVLNPEIVVFGGDICSFPNVQRGFLEPIQRKIRELLPFEMPEIEMSALGEDAGIFGASAMAIESLLTGKYPYKLENQIESIKTG